jgi:hypothetical protein
MLALYLRPRYVTSDFEFLVEYPEEGCDEEDEL